MIIKEDGFRIQTCHNIYCRCNQLDDTKRITCCSIKLKIVHQIQILKDIILEFDGNKIIEMIKLQKILALKQKLDMK